VIAYDRRQFAKQQGAFERLTSDITTIDDSAVNSSASDNFAVVAAMPIDTQSFARSNSVPGTEVRGINLSFAF
jgi:hypothetical protein